MTSPAALQLVEREAALARLLREPLAGREPEPELLRALLAEASLGEVRAHLRSGVTVPEQALEVRRRLLEHGVQALASPALRFDVRRRLLDLDRDAEPVREPLDRADEVEVLRLADEGDDVSALPAAEAVVELVDGVDRERRRLLLVERTATRVSRARRAPELRSSGDHVDHVCGGDDVPNRGVLDARHRVSLLAASVVLSYP